MKKLMLLAGLLVFIGTSCDRPEAQINSKDTASLSIKLVGDKGVSYSVGTPTDAAENEIKNFTVYVFDNDILQKKAVVTGALTTTITGLTIGPKKVVVLANIPSSFPAIEVGAAYSKFAETASYISLDDQTDLTNGLMMSKETTTTLTATPTVSLSLALERLVAKVKLGTVTLPDPATYTGTFVLESVYITKARDKSSVGIPTLVTTDPINGGFAGTMATVQKTYLKETITDTDFANRYFYVFSCADATDANATIIGLQGTFDGTPCYFPFRINDANWGGDGSYIARNTVHTINIKINRPWDGSVDPETPAVLAGLDITVSAEPWVVMPTQNAEW